MSGRRGARGDAGAVLVFVVLLMLALVGLGHGLLVVALAELATSRAGARHLRARTAAEAAVADILRAPADGWMDSISIGEKRAWTPMSLRGASASAVLTRLAPESWLVEGRGRAAEGGGEARTAALAWAPDPLERITALGGVLSGAVDAAWQIEGEVDATDPARVDAPLRPEDCAPWAAMLTSRYAASPMAAIEVLADTLRGPTLGLLDFDALLAAAEVRIDGAGTPGPVERLGACVADEPWGWGDPDRPTQPCGAHLPLRGAEGDLVVEGGAGQGVLVVDGDLELRSGARFHGLVVVRGALRLSGSELHGMAVAWGGAQVGPDARVRASACWAVRALAAQREKLGRLRLVPGVGPLGPL